MAKYNRSYPKRRKTYSKKTVRVSRPLVRRIVNNMAEKKFQDTSFGSAGAPVAITSSWVFVSAVGGITQGTTASTRLGNKIRIKSIEWIFQIAPTVGAPKNGTMCRLIIYRNNEAVGIDITATTLFVSGTANSITAMRNQTLLPRATILRDKMMTMLATSSNAADATATTIGPKTVVRFKIFPNKVLDFQSNAGTISDLFKYDYGFGIIADGNSCCSYYATQQVVWTDA